MQEIQLIAPNGLQIIGAVSTEGTVRGFKYSYDRSTQVRLYEMNDGPSLPDGPVTLQDSEGNRWNSTDVEWHTLFKLK
jgi:hypothetical protein